MKIINGNRKSVELKAAKLISKLLRKKAKNREVVFGIPGGNSVQGILRNLRDKKIPWNKIHIFMADERLVPLTDKKSNYRIVKESLLDYLIKNKKISKENIHPFNPKKSVKEYTKELKKYGGKFDILLLSSGEDGHIASLFPNHICKGKGYKLITNSPKPPKKRVTISEELVKNADTGIIVFFGEEKREALNKFLAKKSDIPAKLITCQKNYYIFTDLKRKK